MRKTKTLLPKPQRAAPKVTKDSTLIKPKLEEKEGSGNHSRSRPVRPLSGKKLAVEIANRPRRAQATKEFAKREGEKLSQAATETRELTTFLPASTLTVKSTHAFRGQYEEPLAKRSKDMEYKRPTREVCQGGNKRRAVQGGIVSLLSSNG